MKRIKLTDFGRDSHVTARGLSKVLQQVKEHGLPDAIGVSSIARQRQEVVYEKTEYGALLQPLELSNKDGSTCTIMVQHPLALLSKILSSPGLIASLILAMDTLELVMYSDEVHPGNAVKGNDRKVYGIYWSIFNFGTARLCMESFWFCAACIRSSTVNKLQGGIAQVYRKLLKIFFGKPNYHDFRNGVSFQTMNGNKLMFATLRMFLHDEAAGKEVALCKGANGVKECILCQTTIKWKSTLLPFPGLIPSTSLDVDRFVLQTNESVRRIARRLQDAADTNSGELKNLEKLLGFTANPESILLDNELALDLIDVWSWDWLHCYCQGGVFVHEVNAFVWRLWEHGFGIDKLDAYLQAFVWPRSMPSALKICRTTSNELRDDLNGSASEFLSLAPVLAHYIVHVVQQRGILAPESASMMAGINVLQLLQCAFTGNVSAGELKDAIVNHLTLQQAAYQFELWQPKSHHVLHLPAMLDKFGVLLSTFVEERKHKIIARYGAPRKNTTSLEKGLMEELTLQQMYDINEVSDINQVKLTHCIAAKSTIVKDLSVILPGLVHADSAIFTSREAKVNCRSILNGDVVVYKLRGAQAYSAGQVWYHVLIDGIELTCLAPWPVSSVGLNSWKCTVRSDPVVISTHCLISPVIYSTATEGNISTLLLTDLVLMYCA